MTKLPDEQARGQGNQGRAEGGPQQDSRGMPPEAAMLANAPEAWVRMKQAEIRVKCLEMALLRPRAQDRERPLVIAQRFWDWASDPNVKATDIDPVARQDAARAAAKASQPAPAGGSKAVDWSHLNRD